MSFQPLRTRPILTSWDKVAWQWSPQIIALGAILVLIATLYPFRLYLSQLPTFHQWLVSFVHPYQGKVDAFSNIVLFMPFGFGLSGWLLGRQRSSLSRGLMVVAMSAAFSFGVEVAQVFIARNSSAMDVITNAFGGGCGYVVFEVARKPIFGTIALTSRLSHRFLSRLELWHVVAGFLGYLMLTMMMMVYVNSFTLSNWDLNAPLFIGGTQTGSQVAWQGQMANLEICDRALSRSELQPYLSGASTTLPCQAHTVASYSLQGDTGLQDQAHVSSPLMSQGDSPPQPSKLGTRVSSLGWLRSQTMDTAINQRIQQSSALTLAVTITPDTIRPRDVAVLSMTPNRDLGNFQLIQVDSHLVFWLRNLFTTDSGSPQGFVGNVLTAGKPCRLVVTYAALSIQGYIEGLDKPVVFNVIPTNFLIISYLAFYPPLGVILSEIIRRSRRRWYWILMATGCILPPLLFELLQAVPAHRSVRLANLVLSIVIVAATSVLAQWMSRKSQLTSLTVET